MGDAHNIRAGLRARQARETREVILRVAHDLFAQRGFAATSIRDILERTDMARGALYHHFRDKEALFAAVWEDTLREAHSNVIAASSQASDIWEALRLGREAYLDSWTDPKVYRILLVDGPNVLSAQTRKRIQQSMGPAFRANALVTASLQALEESGELKLKSVEPLATILGGAFDAAAIAIAGADDPKKARKEVGEALNFLVDGLRAVSAHGSWPQSDADKSNRGIRRGKAARRRQASD
jgi:AcrR family transcriptional regulator